MLQTDEIRDTDIKASILHLVSQTMNEFLSNGVLERAFWPKGTIKRAFLNKIDMSISFLNNWSIAISSTFYVGIKNIFVS